MRRAVPFVPILVVVALLIVPSAEASHLSMDMPGLGGAVVSPPSVVLLLVSALAALLQGAWLVRAEKPARDLGWGLALTPLAVSAASVAPPSSDASLRAHIAVVGAAGSEHMWALLATVALAVGFGAARVIEIDRDAGRTQRPVAALVSLALALPFVGLILATSTGVDAISSWIRWGGCGLAAIVGATAALRPSRTEARAIGATTFGLAVAFSLLAEREYVEALGHDALVHRDPFDPAVEWVRGLQQIAAAVEPRERYGPWLASLPLLALMRRASWRVALPRVAAGLVVLASGALASHAISSDLDARARDAAGPIAARPDTDEIEWSARALPRVTPWLRALAPTDAPAPIRCAGWMPNAPDG